MRNNCLCEAYIDGMECFKNIGSALQAAESQIFITGWWVSPELYLQRNAVEQERFRSVREN